MSLMNNNFYKPKPPPNYLKPKNIEIYDIITDQKVHQEVKNITLKDFLYKEE